MLERAGFPPGSHDRKALLEIIETYPRDSLFQMSADELFDVAMGILGLGERQRVRLFVRRDPLERFVECLVTIPRDRFNTENRERVGADPARGVRRQPPRLDAAAVASRCSCACTTSCTAPTACRRTTTSPRSRRGCVEATRAWTDDLREALIDEHGEERGVELYRRYEGAFPPGYRDGLAGALGGRRHRPRSRSSRAGTGRSSACTGRSRRRSGALRCKLFSRGGGVAVRRAADVRAHGREGRRRAPVRDHAGRRVDRRGSTTSGCGARPRTSSGSATSSRTRSSRVWRGELEDDGLNGLVLAAGLTGREITIMRAVAHYLRQAGIPFSDALHGADAARAIPTSRRCWSSCSARGSIPTAATDGAAERLSDRDRGRRSTRSRASTRTGSCAASCRSSARCCAPTTSVVDDDGRRGRTCRSSSTPRRSRSCRRRGRSSRSSCTRRGSRACTCAAARSRAAACAGRTAARTSAPRSSA